MNVSWSGPRLSARREMLGGSDQEVAALPMVHACSAEDCNVLTMGRFCLEHEQQRAASRRPAIARLATAFVLVAAGLAGAAVRVRVMR